MKAALAAFGALLALVLFSPCAAAAPAPVSPLVRAADGRLMAPDVARIVSRGELLVAMPPTDSAPFFSEKDGKLIGIDVDLARTIGRELGVPVRFERGGANIDAVVEMVGNGQADLAIGRLGRTLKRSQIVHFSTPYMSLRHAMLINRVRFAAIAGERPLDQVMRSFKGQIGVIANTSWEEFGRLSFPLASLKTYPSWEALVEAVKRGEVVAAYRDELEVRAVLERDARLALTLRTVSFSDAESALSVMVGVRDATLLSFVNEVIAARRDRGAAPPAKLTLSRNK